VLCAQHRETEKWTLGQVRLERHTGTIFIYNPSPPCNKEIFWLDEILTAYSNRVQHRVIRRSHASGRSPK